MAARIARMAPAIFHMPRGWRWGMLRALFRRIGQ
jgi:hypothetical protein